VEKVNITVPQSQQRKRIKHWSGVTTGNQLKGGEGGTTLVPEGEKNKHETKAKKRKNHLSEGAFLGNRKNGPTKGRMSRRAGNKKGRLRLK